MTPGKLLCKGSQPDNEITPARSCENKRAAYKAKAPP